jgi:hypothetical protein
VVLAVAARFVNALLVDRTSRAAASRDGGSLLDTGVVPANGLLEGDGPTIVLIRGFGAARHRACRRGAEIPGRAGRPDRDPRRRRPPIRRWSKRRTGRWS